VTQPLPRGCPDDRGHPGTAVDGEGDVDTPSLVGQCLDQRSFDDIEQHLAQAAFAGRAATQCSALSAYVVG
jgi:hypothetical protein